MKIICRENQIFRVDFVQNRLDVARVVVDRELAFSFQKLGDPHLVRNERLHELAPGPRLDPDFFLSFGVHPRLNDFPKPLENESWPLPAAHLRW